MFQQHNDQGYKEIAPGISIKTLVWGDKSSLTVFKLQKGATLAMHTHPHEQNGYMVSGHMQLTIGDETHDINPGDAWSVPGDLTHGGQVFEDSVIIEVFTPVRENYLPEK